MVRLAGAVDRSVRGDADERAFARLAVAFGKYWVCKRQPAVVTEALECLGGNGYVEESEMPRLYREAPLDSIWEGSANVQALDVLRVLAREPASVEAFLARGGARRRRGRTAGRLVGPASRGTPRRRRGQPRDWESGWCWSCRPPSWCGTRRRWSRDAFCATWVDGDWGHTFGTLPAGVDTGVVLERAAPGRVGQA